MAAIGETTGARDVEGNAESVDVGVGYEDGVREGVGDDVCDGVCEGVCSGNVPLVVHDTKSGAPNRVLQPEGTTGDWMGVVAHVGESGHCRSSMPLPELPEAHEKLELPGTQAPSAVTTVVTSAGPEQTTAVGENAEITAPPVAVNVPLPHDCFA